MFLKEISEYYKKSTLVFPDIEALFNITKTNHGLLNQITNLNGNAPEVLNLKLPAPVKPVRWEDSQFKDFLSEIKTNRDRIIQSFVSETSIFRVYLPDEQIKSLESAVKADLIHPNIFREREMINRVAKKEQVSSIDHIAIVSW